MQDQLAADGVTPPWLVAEWHVVEAFVRKRPEILKTQWRGIPGVGKSSASCDLGSDSAHGRI
jgi:hypothetical protein